MVAVVVAAGRELRLAYRLYDDVAGDDAGDVNVVVPELSAVAGRPAPSGSAAAAAAAARHQRTRQRAEWVVIQRGG